MLNASHLIKVYTTYESPRRVFSTTLARAFGFGVAGWLILKAANHGTAAGHRAVNYAIASRSYDLTMATRLSKRLRYSLTSSLTKLLMPCSRTSPLRTARSN